MPLIVVYDANVLYQSVLRDFLLRIAQEGLVQAKWTDRILDETFTALSRNNPNLSSIALHRTRTLMNLSIRDVLISGHESLITRIELPDANDRHVLAAAIRCRAQVIVTFNEKDFPQEALNAWGVRAQHPDEFLIELFASDSALPAYFGQQITSSYCNPPWTLTDLSDALQRSGMPKLAALLLLST